MQTYIVTKHILRTDGFLDHGVVGRNGIAKSFTSLREADIAAASALAVDKSVVLTQVFAVGRPEHPIIEYPRIRP